MKNLFKTLAIFCLFSFPLAAETTDKNAEHEAFAKSFATTVLAIVHDVQRPYNERKEVLRNAFAKSVDIDWIAKFVLGKSWAAASEEQREKYSDLYKRFLTQTYVTKFAEDPKKRIRDIKVFGVTDVTQEADSTATDFTVRTQMQLTDNENLRVNYLVNENDGRYKIRDFAIENVSLIAAHRAEFSKLASSVGVDGVIKDLETRLDAME